MMYTKEEIFSDIQDILSKDYAGFLDKKDINIPGKYKISNHMSNTEFEEEIQNYLLDFEDGHLWFINKDSNLPDRGFSVRRFEDVLYVTEAIQESRLNVGDKITHIEGIDIPSLLVTYSKYLESKVNERQLWDGVLKKLSSISVQSVESSFDMMLSSYKSR